MAKLAIIALFSLTIFGSCYGSLIFNRNEWNLFKQQHNKAYESFEIEILKRAIYLNNKEMIEKFNAEESEKLGYRLGINHLADYTSYELSRLNGLKLGQGQEQLLLNSPEAQGFLDAIYNDKSEVPDELDWRKVPGRVARVKDQKQCKSCWAFATVGLLEGQEAVRNKSAIRDGQLTELSEQNLIDCDHNGDEGCHGGLMVNALNFVKQEGGIETEAAYPYEEKDGTCRFEKSKSVMTDAGAAILPEGDEQKLKEVVAKYGPVSVGVDADSSFQFYEQGVLNSRTCKNDLHSIDHAVLVVGYGTDKIYGDYWIVKNSWGPTWGEDGYIRMARNKGNKCGIASMATIATF